MSPKTKQNNLNNLTNRFLVTTKNTNCKTNKFVVKNLKNLIEVNFLRKTKNRLHN